MDADNCGYGEECLQWKAGILQNSPAEFGRMRLKCSRNRSLPLATARRGSIPLRAAFIPGRIVARHARRVSSIDGPRSKFL